MASFINGNTSEILKKIVKRMISQTFIIRSFLQLYIVHLLKETKRKEKVKTNIFFFFFSSLFYTVTVPLSLSRIVMVDGVMSTEW